MFTSSNILPILSTSRITVSRPRASSVQLSKSVEKTKPTIPEMENIQIEFSLKDFSNQRQTSWSGNSKEVNFLEVYFVLLSDDQISAITANLAPEKRMEILTSPTSGLSLNPREVISLAEILEKSQFRTKEGGTAESKYIHELHHEVNIKYRNRRKNTGLHLVSFIHLNMEKKMEERGIQTSAPRSMKALTISGPTVYDHILESTLSSNLTIPKNRSAMFVDDPKYPNLKGQPYAGITHLFQDPSTSAPPVFVSGTPSSPGPKLRERIVPNHKIVLDSSVHLDPRVDLSFVANTGVPRSTTGKGLNDFKNSIIDGKDLFYKTRNHRDRARLRLSEGFSQNLGIMSYGSQDTCNTYVDRKNIEKSYQSTIFGINFLNLLVKKSLFGDILNFHATSDNFDFVQRALFYSEITSLNITRTRLSAHPNVFNKAGTPEYGKFEFGETDQVLVFASDQPSPRGGPFSRGPLKIKHRLKKAETVLACLEEVEIMKASPQGEPINSDASSRQFMIKDYDLFHNIDHGKYTYNISISVRDGVRWAIKEILENLNSSIENYKKYVSIASIPVIQNYLTATTTGNYDHHTQGFTSSFSEREDFEGIISSVIDSFSEVVKLMSGTTIREPAVNSIRNSISPALGKLSSIEEFLDTLNSVSGIIESTLDLGKTPSYGRDIYHNKETNVSSGTTGFSEILEESFGTNIIVEAFNKSNLMADYSFPQALPAVSLMDILSSRISNSGTDYQTQLPFTPQSFIAVSPSSFDAPSVDIRKQNKQSRSLALRSSGGVQEISNYSDYTKSNAAAQQIMTNKIALLRAGDSSETGLINKSDVYTMQALPKLGGSITIGLSAHGTNFSTPKDLLQLEESTLSESEGLPDSVKTAISTAIYKGDDRDLTLTAIRENHRDIAQTKDQLGMVFDKMYNIFAMTRDLKLTTSLNANYKQKALGNKKESQNTLTNSTNPYDTDIGTPKVITLGQEKVDLNLRKILNLKKKSTRTEKKFMIISIDTGNEDKIRPVNSTFLLEV